MNHDPLRPDLPHLPADRIRVRRDALRREIAPAETRAAPARRRWAAVAGAGLATLAAAGAAVVLADRVQPPPAGTATVPAAGPTVGPDGTLLVRQADMADPTAANAELRRVGARALLVTTRTEADCPRADRGTEARVDMRTGFGSDAAVTLPAGGGVLIHPDRVPEGLLLAVHLRPEPVNDSRLSGWAFYRLPGPRCVVTGATRSFDDPALGTPGHD
ncbi:hypothetical protein [Micromonospora halophytica]|uniref:Uncharacterized protein n=1 Tax=Micromonospora halophytica TaxID=47864 RepID=A0A1C5H5V6_9ACTN|nr:hypothetical protein [Micromonospora halophytica]SCG41426.1 hypothetical protein GA0070560_103149 [Micromonospora halophytica]